MRCIDLHIHTTYSDGAFTPRQAVHHAKHLGLAAIAITDHDITDGLDEAIKEGELVGVEVVPGVELNVYDEKNLNNEIHILGYYIDWKNKELQDNLKKFRETRRMRALKIIKKLGDLGVYVDKEKVYEISRGGSIGRMHFAHLLEKGRWVNSISEAFERYLAYGKPAYVPKFILTPQEGIKIIHNAGGIPIIAHPIFGGTSDKIIVKLAKIGLAGVEIYHSKHLPEDTEDLRKLAKKLNLLVTGGTDCHGPLDGNQPRMGSIPISYQILEDLKRRIPQSGTSNSPLDG